MKILISGSSGLIGAPLTAKLKKEGHEVVRLVRLPTSFNGSSMAWDPQTGQIDQARLEGFDAVIHLAGDNIAEGRWTPKKKSRIRESRIKGTRHLAQALTQMKKPPSVFVVASAIGIYGDRGNEELTEESKEGTGFLPQVCQEWEAAAKPAQEKGIRVVHLRFGAVLSSQGGALGKMLIPFRMGVGGKLGQGDQYMSWVGIDDTVKAIEFSLTHSELKGPVNVVAPFPVTNLEFTKTLGKVLRRPTLFSVPAFGARLAFGELADAILLASNRVQPKKLLDAGFKFESPRLEEALRVLLAR